MDNKILKGTVEVEKRAMTFTEGVIIGILIGLLFGMILTGKMAVKQSQRAVQRAKDIHMAAPYECMTLPVGFDGVIVDVTVDIKDMPIITTNKIVRECK